MDDEERKVGWARFAVAVPGAYFLVNLLLQRANADQLRSAGHQFRIDFHDAQLGRTAPAYHAPANSLAPIGLLVGALTIAAVIIACVWQHKAASAGRALHIPSQYSPAWGVGCWFVPIVNLWMPYGAIRDCLPPGHPHRTRWPQWWLALLLAWSLSVAAGIAALFSTGTGLVLAIPAALACLAVIAWGPGIVVAIAAAHRRSLDCSDPGNRGVPDGTLTRLVPSLDEEILSLRTVHLWVALLLLHVHLASLRSW